MSQFNFDFGGLTVEIRQHLIKTEKLNTTSSYHKLLELFLENQTNQSISDKNISEFTPIAKKLEDKSLSLIMAFPERNSLRRQEVMDLIGLTNQTYNTDRYLTPLIETGLISQIIKIRPNSSKQKYILTEKGTKFKFLLTNITN